MNSIRELYIDFIEYRRVRHLNKISELSSIHKVMIESYNKDFEKEMNELILGKLAEEMVENKISPEFYKGFRSALMWRISFLGIKDRKFNK